MSTVSLASSTSDSASNGTTSVFSHRETNTFDKCPRCMIPYDFLKRTNTVSSKVPLILNCKHTVCEDCIRRVCLANPANAACPVCNEKFLVPRAQIDSLTEVFHPHFALIGQMMWTKNSPNKKNINWISTGVTLKNRQIANVENAEVNSEADVPDNSEMESVDGDFENNVLSLEFEKCPEHGTMFVNVSCETCLDEMMCCYCFLEKHQGHTPVYLYKLSKEEKAEMKRFKRDMELILKHLQASQKKITQLKNFDLTYVESEIKTCFADLHAKLHLAERNLRKKLVTFKADEPNLGIINPTLKCGIARVEQALKYLNMEHDNQINVRALYGEIQSLKEIPCRLVSDSESLIESVEFICKNDFDRIEDNFDLKRTEGLEYSLIPIVDWTHEEAQACIKDRLCDNLVPSSRILKSEVDPPVLHRSSSSTGTVKKPRASETKIKVTVTHINSLNSFYVQKHSIQVALKQMNKSIETKPKRKLSCGDVKPGRIYGVKYEIKNKTQWRRGKLINSLKKGDNVLFSVFFIDYGNTKEVTADKLKEVDEWVFKKAPYCFECRLTNPNNDDFGINAHLHLPKIIGEKSLYLKFIHNPPVGIKEVDLLIPSSDGTAISVRDVLLNTTSEKEEFIIPRNVKLYKNSKRFSIGQSEQVMVSYIVDPFNISVQLTHNKDPLEKMKREMASFYNSDLAASCIPVVGTDVVIRYQSEFQGAWHRGTINSVSNIKRTVNVHFVDWGGNATVGWSHVYMLAEEFTKVECQAITVRLADLQRENVDEPWPQEVCDFLKEQVEIGDRFRMVVQKENPLEVALFKIGSSADICVNTLLVEHNHAVSTGNITETLYWPNQSNAEEEPDDNNEFCVQLLKKAENILVDDEDVNLRHKTKQIRVLRFDNPELIYVKYLKHDKEEEEMDKDLQIHYSNRRVNQDKWRHSEKCVVYDTCRSRYFRGIIKEPCGLNNYIVYLFDHARDIQVSKKLIYKHDAYFQKWGCHVNKCRLFNIKPAGDPGKWSSLSLEILQKIFNTYKIIHMAVLERNPKDKIFSVIMWYSLNRTPKALEPSRYRFISINKVLLEAGVAFSAGVHHSFVNIKAHGEKDEDEKDVDESTSCSADETAESKDDKSKDWYDIILEDESAPQSWLEPIRLQNTVFEAVLTCVDNEGCCFIRNEELQEYYLKVEESMNSKFRKLKLIPENVEWQPNEMCSILYDDNWYRGTVLEVVNSREVVVEMIDYGSEHTVEKNEIFKLIMFAEMPPLVNKVRLYDVHSRRGAWNADDVQELLQVVADNVKVVIKSELDIDIPEAEIYLENGLSINDLITQRCAHLVRYENKVALVNGDELDDYVEYIEEEDAGQTDGASDDTRDLNSSQDALTYTYAELPKSPTRKCKMTVLNVLKSKNEFTAVLTASDDDSAEVESFVTLTYEMQEHAQEQPTLNDIEVGTPCVCWHSQNDEWCRAQIYNIDSLPFNYVSAFFVDYGTIHTVVTDKLKEIRPEWLNLPVPNRMALINIELMDSSRVEDVIMQMNNLKGNVVTVEVVSDDPLIVHLYDDKNLCYQNFINCGIIRAI